MRASIVLLVMLGLAARSARADGVGVVVTGDAAIQPQLAAQIEEWLRQRGHTLIAAPLRPDGLGQLIDCLVIEDLKCARRIVETEGQAPRVVFAKAELVATGTVRDITLTAYWFSKGSDPMAARRTCSACTETTIHSTIDEVMSTLAGKARVDVGTLELSVTPATAQIRIDGADGTTGAALPVGQHVVEVSAPGYATQRRTIAIKGGEKTALSLQLVPVASRSKLPLVGIGAGVALTAIGIALIVTSEEDTGQKPEYRDTRAGGIALTGVGVVAIAVCAWWYMRSSATPDSSPTIAVVPGGATLGWVGAF
ncbi:MAG: PEGA domain-containing protein [Kofleriaceae bacterium]